MRLLLASGKRGRVADSAQLAPYRRTERIDQIATFFNSRTTPQEAWTLVLTGGEPLLMPNLGRLCSSLFAHGSRMAFNTSLFVDEGQPNFKFLRDCDPSSVDYIMASFHPEAEQNESVWFRKLEMLKRAGHKILLRYVSQPARLHRLEELSKKCEDLDVPFYPTVLESSNYPAAYSADERSRLSSHFTLTSQFIQMEGGIDTRNIRCFAGSKVIGVDLRTGNITPCITVSSPSLGNIYEDRLALYDADIACPEPGINCTCDVHFQQDIIIGVTNNKEFTQLKHGFSAPKRAGTDIESMRSKGIRFYGSRTAGIGGVQDDSKPFYTIQEVKESLKRTGPLGTSHRSFRTMGEVPPLFRLEDVKPWGKAVVSGNAPIRIETPAERWAYAALFPLQAQDSTNGKKTFVVRLEYSIERGKVGIGCITPDISTYVGEGEKFVAENDSLSNITIDLADGAGWLVIRNASADGQPSVLRLRGIRTFAAEPVTAIA